MIQKINFTTKAPKASSTDYSNKKESKVSDTNSMQLPVSHAPSNLLQSYYVSFGGKKPNKSVNGADNVSSKAKMAEIEANASYHGEKLLKDSRELAKKHGHSEVNQIHVLRVGLGNILDYINQLNSGEVAYEDESSMTVYVALEESIDLTVFKDEKKRAKIKPVIEKNIAVLDKKLENMPELKSKNNNKNQKIDFSKDYLNDVYSLYMQDNGDDMMGDGLVHDMTIFDAALMPSNDEIKKITVPFITELKDVMHLDKRPLSERIHLSFYDEKAANIWKNLAIGTNMALLYDKESTPSYLVNSFIHAFENSKNGFGNLTKENTELINFNDSRDVDNAYLVKKFQEYRKNKDKNYILVMSIMDKDADSLDVRDSTVEAFKSAPKNVKFVMVADKDAYYKSADDEFFSDFGEVLAPLMNMPQAQKMFKEQPKLMEKIKKPFSKQAIEKSVEAANVLKGNYPEKAQKVMELVSAYYVDKDKISLDDVQNYVKEAKEIFKPVENDSSVKIVFDTGIKLKDLVGSPTTKKEAQSIVERIKDKSIGTKGFVIYSQDGSVGAGRKYTAQSIAGEAKVPYMEINAVDFGTKDVDLFGFGNLSPEASMKKLFGMAKAQAETNPQKSAVLFVENFEYFSLGEMVSEYHEKAMSQLIREMNKAQEQGLNIVVIGSMNNPDYIGAATQKSFKFIDQIAVETPANNKDARREIIDYYIKQKGLKLTSDEKEREAIKTHMNLLADGASYVEILTFLDKAKNVAKERKHKTVEKADCTEAILQLSTGRPSSAQLPPFEKDVITSHECGHALNTAVMESIMNRLGKPWHKGPSISYITLDPRGYFGGCVCTTDTENNEYSLEKIFTNLVVDFGGNSCENKFYGIDGSWGITTDMAMATEMASMATGIMGQGSNFGKKSMNGMYFLAKDDEEKMNKDIDVMLKNAKAVSDAITNVYADFNREFTEKYSPRVATGECIIHRDEFMQMLNEWIEKQSPEKRQQMEALDKDILKVIDATKKGVVCSFKA